MSRQPLGKKWIRRIERLIGEPVVWASGNGTYWHAFTTAEHRHGVVRAKPPYEIEWPVDPIHMSSCRRIFGGGWDE